MDVHRNTKFLTYEDSRVFGTDGIEQEWVCSLRVEVEDRNVIFQIVVLQRRIVTERFLWSLLSTYGGVKPLLMMHTQKWSNETVNFTIEGDSMMKSNRDNG